MMVELAIAVLVSLPGVSMLLVPARKRQQREARLAQLRAGAPERFFEERRALEAYPVGSDRRIRVTGLAMIAVGLIAAGAPLLLDQAP